MSTPGVLITGASGFVGQALLKRLQGEAWPLQAQRQSEPASQPPWFQANLAELVNAKHLSDAPSWQQALSVTRTCIHLAGLAHRGSDTPTNDYERLNHQASAGLARLAAQAGHRRLIFVSSINAMGDQSGKLPLTPDTEAVPTDAYGRSKLAAERSLQEISAHTGLEVVVIRPPLVYGAGAKGNLLKLMKLIHGPLPVPAILPQTMPANRRSMIGLPNLADLLVQAIDHPRMAGRTLLPSDASFSTATLIERMAVRMGRRTKLRLPVPAALITALGKLSGREAFTRRLTASLLVRDDWLQSQPDVYMTRASEDIVDEMVGHFLDTHSADAS